MYVLMISDSVDTSYRGTLLSGNDFHDLAHFLDLDKSESENRLLQHSYGKNAKMLQAVVPSTQEPFRYC